MAQKNGARLTRLYTDQQRDALLHAVLVDKLTQAEAERRAMAGTLREDLAPFGRPRFSYSLLRRGRAEYEAGNDEALDNGHTAELKRLHRLALNKARLLNETSDVAEIARTSKALAEAHRALRGLPTNTKPPKPKASASEPSPETPAQSQDDTLATLVNLANTTKPASYDANTGDSDPGEARGPVRSLAR